jgi:toxin YoeB
MNKVFSDQAWEDYSYWIENDRRILKRIHELLKDIERNGNTGIGKPEPLKHDLEGFWSRRITEEHRLIYNFEAGSIFIAKCRKHY